MKDGAKVYGFRSKLSPPIFFAFYCGLFLSAITAYKLVTGRMILADDAYYYFVIARNIATTHISTFDGQSLTNGYHPLWMALLIIKYFLFGDNVAVTLVMQIIITSLALFFLLLPLNCLSVLSYAIFSLIYIRLMRQMTVDGMEISLWALCLSILIYACAKINSFKAPSSHSIGLMMAACIASRLDSAVFILPFGLLALRTLRQRFIALSVVGACGLVYAGWSYMTFGLLYPVSGMVKSLGGLQINRPLLGELTGALNPAEGWWKIPLKVVLDGYWQMIALWVAAPFLMSLLPLRSLARKLLIAYFIGFLAYFLKLLFFSSWIIWGWYRFPALIGVTGSLYMLLPLLEQKAKHITGVLGQAAPTITMIALVAALVLPIVRMERKEQLRDDFETINKLATEKYAPVLAGQRVAMGDRAGSFAYFYGGGVTQLEGLVNDKEYFEKLSSKGDIKSLLCKRGVRFLISYSTDLGDKYFYHDVSTLRPWLTQFPGPSIRVFYDQQVGKIFDLSKFDNKTFEEGDNWLYIWRVDCPKDS